MQPDVDYNKITDQLYVGKTPTTADFELLAERGVRLAINMRIEHIVWPSLVPGRMRVLWVPTIDHWLFPIFPWYIRWAVKRAVHVMASGGSVYCSCMKGRHRSVLMATCILIAQGYSVEQAIKTIKSARPAADPEASHIYRQIRAFAAYWQHRN